MNKTQRKQEFLRKLIDLPRPIVGQLQNLAHAADRSLKSYIEELIVNDVQKHASHLQKSDNEDDAAQLNGNGLHTTTSL